MINQTIKGDLIEFILDGKFDVAVQGNNCFSKQKKGLALGMSRTFNTDEFKYELTGVGDINKMGVVDWGLYNKLHTKNGKNICIGHHQTIYKKEVLPVGMYYVCNLYTQYTWANTLNMTPINYSAIELCFVKMNSLFKKYKVGIPKIGAGLAGGDWNKISNIINNVTPDLDITLVEF